MSTRPAVDAIDRIVGRRFRVLDDGFVRLVDYMGSDAAVVQAARVSYGAGTKRVREDRALSRFLMRHGHTTPFEMCELKLHVRVPMDCWRQWIRHRTASVNEYSTRYSIAIDSMHRTAPQEWRAQSSADRQGSRGGVSLRIGRALSREEKALQVQARAAYRKRLAGGVAREQARKDLPLSTFTEAYWKIDLHNLLHFLRLRLDQHAQYEIRQYAEVIGRRIVSRWCPAVWEAFQDYQVQAVRLSRPEQEAVRVLNPSGKRRGSQKLVSLGFMRNGDQGLVPTREGLELAEKLLRLGIPRPW